MKLKHLKLNGPILIEIWGFSNNPDPVDGDPRGYRAAFDRSYEKSLEQSRANIAHKKYLNDLNKERSPESGEPEYQDIRTSHDDAAPSHGNLLTFPEIQAWVEDWFDTYEAIGPNGREQLRDKLENFINSQSPMHGSRMQKLRRDIEQRLEIIQDNIDNPRPPKIRSSTSQLHHDVVVGMRKYGLSPRDTRRYIKQLGANHLVSAAAMIKEILRLRNKEIPNSR